MCSGKRGAAHNFTAHTNIGQIQGLIRNSGRSLQWCRNGICQHFLLHTGFLDRYTSSNMGSYSTIGTSSRALQWRSSLSDIHMHHVKPTDGHFFSGSSGGKRIPPYRAFVGGVFDRSNLPTLDQPQCFFEITLRYVIWDHITDSRLY